MTSPIEDAILRLLAEAPAGKSFEAMTVAKAVDPDNWRHRLGHVRNEAVRMAKEGTIVILRHNKPTDPDRFKGVWRFRLPLADDPPLASLRSLAEDDDIEILDEI